MQVYLDTSALLKLIVKEPESSALETYLGGFQSDRRFTAALARAELVRAVARRESTASVEHARRVLGRLDLVPLTNRLLDAAAAMTPQALRTLDAIHLATAMTAPDLRAVVTYDRRLADAAAAHGIPAVNPGVSTTG